jgi:poly-gamma-glutamate capsule biosynthesis protein CapA/YwtB (metallophosphatase superfamily)
MIFSHFAFHTLAVALAFAHTGSVHSIFPPEEEEIVQEPVKLLFLGDIMLGRHVGELMDEEGLDPFEHVHRTLREYDLVVGNLEGPITEASQCQNKAYSFKFSPRVTTMLTMHNINMVSLANNHSMDCYRTGLEDTRMYLDDADILHVGGGNDIEEMYRVVQVGDREIVFVGYDDTVRLIPHTELYKTVERVSLEYPYTVVVMHWGQEYETMYSRYQQEIAHTLVDLGADLVVGHHPHVTQPAEFYNGVPIYYSLGNFVFDQYFGDTTKGYAVSVSLSDRQDVYSTLPYEIIHTQPVFLHPVQ